MGAVDLGLVYSGGILPGFEGALQVAPGGFDPNYYKRNQFNSPGMVVQGTGGSDSFLFGSEGNDYLVGYGGGVVGEVDSLFGSNGADVFALGDSTYGVYYAPVQGYGIFEDYSAEQGDVIQLSALGVGDYSLNFGDLRSDGVLDTVILYGNQPIAVAMNTTNPVFTLA